MTTQQPPQSTTYQWCELRLELSASQRKRIKKWMLRAALSSDGTVFIPSAIAGSEMEVLLCAGYDGTQALVSGDHAYYPADWVAREFPAAAETVRNIERNVRECLA